MKVGEQIYPRSIILNFNWLVSNVHREETNWTHKGHSHMVGFSTTRDNLS